MKNIKYLNTKIKYITNKDDDAAFLENAAIILRKGGLVAFPTETVYGIGANALNEKAVNKIFVAKGRPSDNPLIVHIAKKDDVYLLADDISEIAKKLIDNFWPGPLTIILNKSQIIPNAVTAGLDTVAIRMPSDTVARWLIKKAGVPVAAPSANLSGKPSPTCAEHVIEDLSGRVDCIIAGNNSKVGIESTVIDLTKVPPVILRPGYITKEQIQNIIGKVDELGYETYNERPISPGLKYRHYSPKAPLTLFMGNSSNVFEKIIEQLQSDFKKDKKIGVLCCEEHKNQYEDILAKSGCVQSLGLSSEAEVMIKNLFSSLRNFDKCDVDIILCESFSEEGVGKALMNRLVKAAGGSVVYCK